MASRVRILLLAALPLAVGGCFGLNHVQVFTVSIVNNTANEVIVRDCSDYCSASPLLFDLPPGASTQVHRTTNEHKYFSIATTSGGHLGCLDLYYSAPANGAGALVSSAAPCPSGSGSSLRTVGLILLACVALATLFLGRRIARGR